MSLCNKLLGLLEEFIQLEMRGKGFTFMISKAIKQKYRSMLINLSFTNLKLIGIKLQQVFVEVTLLEFKDDRVRPSEGNFLSLRCKLRIYRIVFICFRVEKMVLERDKLVTGRDISI